MPEVIKLSQPLFEDTGYVNFLNCASIYDNGKYSNLATTKDWADNFYAKYNNKSQNTLVRMKQGWNYWKRNKAREIGEIMEDARDNFDIAARIEFVSRDDVNKCFHLFSFYSDREHEDRAYYFYDVHRGKLLKFLSYFQRAAAKLIKKANQPNNLITIPGYSIEDIENPFRNYNEELRLENEYTEMTSREFEVMCMYSNGFTLQQIADMLGKSRANIDTFCTRLFTKHGFKDRSDMRKYVIANGYDNLDSFFLGSYPIYINGQKPGDQIPSIH